MRLFTHNNLTGNSESEGGGGREGDCEGGKDVSRSEDKGR